MPPIWGQNTGYTGQPMGSSGFLSGAMYGQGGQPKYLRGGTPGTQGYAGADAYGSWQRMGSNEMGTPGHPWATAAAPAAPAAAPAPAAPSAMQINTSIDPTGVYSPTQTSAATNMARAQAGMPLPWLLQHFARQGMSSDSPAMLAQAMPQYAQSRLQQNMVGQQIPFQDAQANAQQLLSGQNAREQEALGLGGALANVNSATQRFNASNASSLLNMLGGFL